MVIIANTISTIIIIVIIITIIIIIINIFQTYKSVNLLGNRIPEFFSFHVHWKRPMCASPLPADRLVGLVVKASASRAGGPGFESR